MPTRKTQIDQKKAISVAEYERRQKLYTAFLWITQAEALERDAALFPNVIRDRDRPRRLRVSARRLVSSSGIKKIAKTRADHGDEEAPRRFLRSHPEQFENEFGASYQELWTLSDENPNQAMALAMRELPSENFISQRGRNVVDAFRHLTGDQWKRFLDFRAAEARGETPTVSQWEIFLEAWGEIVARVRGDKLTWSAIPEDEARPVDLPGDSLGFAQWPDYFQSVSKSTVVIHGKRFVDVRFRSVEDTPAKSGERGRPDTARRLYLAEAEARATRGELTDPVMAHEAKRLEEWMAANHSPPLVPKPELKTIKSNLGKEWKRLMAVQRAVGKQEAGKQRTAGK